MSTHGLPAPTLGNVIATLDGKEEPLISGLGPCTKPSHIGVFPAHFFQPNKEGIYRRIYESDARDGHEADKLWNVGYDLEISLAATHEILAAIDISSLDSLRQKLAVQVRFPQHAFSGSSIKAVATSTKLLKTASLRQSCTPASR